MTDILIRGMEMPKTCSQCPMCQDYVMCKLNSFAFWNTNNPFDFRNERLAGCPLIELPEHGDLIDVGKAKDVKFQLDDDFPNDYQIGWNDAIDSLAESAPVIVPANKGVSE